MKQELPSKSARTDAKLVLAARRGEKSAFVEIVARYQAMVCGIAFAILNDFPASEDAAQDAFLGAWRKIEELREPEKLRAWLAQIARNAALAQLRGRVKDGALPEHLVDSSKTPDEVAATEEESALVRDALERLSESYRLPLVLFYREGKSVRAVAEALEISEDAAKQRLARGREMLRTQIEGVLERVLIRTGPDAIFTMTIAAAIGALAAPSALAAGAFSTSAGIGSTSTAFFSIMSTTKGLAAIAVLVALLSVPVGYQIQRSLSSPQVTQPALSAALGTALPARPSYETSALFAEWQALHERHGTNPAAMPRIFKEIESMPDSARRRAFRLALAAEWAEVDGRGGLAFLLGRQMVGGVGEMPLASLYREWFKLDPNAAIDGLVAATGPGKDSAESLLRRSLGEIARKAPERVAEIAARSPKGEFWESSIADAFAILAENHFSETREIAEKLPGVNREAALAGIAQAWAKTDIDAAIEWARQLPAGIDREEIIRGALFGLAKTDVKGALDRISLVPSGRGDRSGSTTGGRVLRQAVEVDFESTVAWLAANSARLSRNDLGSIFESVTDRLNADPVGFLTSHSNDGTLGALEEAIDNALLNGASGLRPILWDWLRQEPSNPTIERLRLAVLRSAGWKEPELALRMAKDIPANAEGEKLAREVAGAVLDGGYRMRAFEQLYAQAPERVRAALVSAVLEFPGPEAADRPLVWLKRVEGLPAGEQERLLPRIARAWAMKRPGEAAEWLNSVPSDRPARRPALSNVAAAWLDADEPAAAQWISSLPTGADYDIGTEELVYRRSRQSPEDALQLALTIGDEQRRERALTSAVKGWAARDSASARQKIEALPITLEMKEKLRTPIARRNQR